MAIISASQPAPATFCVAGAGLLVPLYLFYLLFESSLHILHPYLLNIVRWNRIFVKSIAAAACLKIILVFTISDPRFRMLFILLIHSIGLSALSCSVTPSAAAICLTSCSNISCACLSMSAR